MSSEKYDPKQIESKWQKAWEESGIYKTTESSGKPKFYVLDMFPYPSGEGLHVGHPKGYIATDVVSRMKRMQGFNVLHPMGFDAFGLPAEQYAIKMKVNPAVAVEKNVARYKKQLEILGFDYDWSREINTTDPKYYKWTQWIFLKLLERGLAEERYEPINWCPVDKTGLSNEDIEDGKCERCGAVVEKRLMKQWVLKITKYADRMLADLDATDYVMPAVVDTTNPPREDKSSIERKNVHAIVYDPAAKKYLILRNKKHGWDTVIIGGIEDGESPIETALRELREETGYVDLEFKRQLGGEVKASYFAKHKDVNRVAYSTGLYFELRSSEQVEYSTEGENEGNEVVWVDEADFVPGKMVNSELPIWLSRLNAEVSINPKTGIAHFKDISPISAVQPDKPFVERKAIAAIVKHWEEDKYLALQWKKVSWRTLITGGPEGDEPAEEGARREVIEETGFQNPKLVRKLGNVDATFYHNPKGVNRVGNFDAFYFELADGERRELSAEESENHEAVWLTKEEMEAFLTPSAQKYIWHTLFLQKKDSHFMPAKPLLDWPESIKESQRNWIGRSEGAEIDFDIKDDLGAKMAIATVFTTQADTLFGVTYIVLAPEHPLVKQLLENVENRSEIESYITSVKAKTEIERTDATKEKTGVEIKGVKAANPANGEQIPVYVADYVLADYGTGAVMAVPAHDERDFEFARKYHLPIRHVIAKYFLDEDTPPIPGKREVPRTAVNCYIRNPKDNTYLCLEWKNVHWKGPVTGGVEEGEDPIEAAKREIYEETGYKNVRFIKSLGGPIRVDFYHPAKDENRYATFLGMHFDLLDEEKDETAASEKDLHDVRWIKEEEVLGFLNKGMLFFRRLLEGKETAFTEDGALVNSGTFDNLSSSEARAKIASAFGRPVVRYKLRDWVFSRQRYWGEPIPVLHDEAGSIVPLKEKDLPLELPHVDQYEPTDNGESPLANITAWVDVVIDGKKYRRETNTMPQWAGSSWYYIRYMDPNNDSAPVDPAKEKYWNSVDLYVGGAEHATRHLIYARFWHKFLYDIGAVSTIEPFTKLQSVGLIMASDGRKMSKRWGNVINPDEMVETFGADSMRLYEMFMGPFDQAIAWNVNGVVGTRRFIEKVWRLKDKIGESKDVSTLLNQTIKKVTDDISAMKFNTAISSLMILVNKLDEDGLCAKTVFETLLKLLAPFAPHVAEELWHELGSKTSIHLAPWPSYDPSKLEADTVAVAIQINGKTREVMEVAKDLSEEAAREQALAWPGVEKWVGGKGIKRVIWVKNRIINLIIDL